MTAGPVVAPNRRREQGVEHRAERERGPFGRHPRGKTDFFLSGDPQVKVGGLQAGVWGWGVKVWGLGLGV